MMNISGLTIFVKERYAILQRRTAGQPKPWTKDAILQDYKFCNVYREDDAGTKWLAQNWRTPNADDPDLWFSMVVARVINKPATLEQLGYQHTWNADKFIQTLHHVKSQHVSAFSGAYMVTTFGASVDKAEFWAHRVFTPLWKDREYIRPRDGDTLADFHHRLTQYYGMGSFLAAQVIADLKYVEPLRYANDWWTWAASGPGSRRGLNRVYGRPVNKAWTEEAWRNGLFEAHITAEQVRGFPQMHAQDFQNCLCEFDKYERVRRGEGVPKRKYNGRV